MFNAESTVAVYRPLLRFVGHTFYIPFPDSSLGEIRNFAGASPCCLAAKARPSGLLFP